ncbi:MAG: sulfotransferase [Proteobacteria bacterium]|nr:sulfotransferase [Pseudomonadota bacterium]
MQEKPKIIFISGRFRAGTSLLWQVFEKLNPFCAWYEPLHPQLAENIRHVKPKTDHLGIEDYWQIYREKPEFSKYYCRDFSYKNLLLSKSDTYGQLQLYIQHLIELSGDKIPVFQFNRMDLRLGWLKANFPEGKIIHIIRDPVSLWFSQRKHIPEHNRNNESYPDAYELMQWSIALSKHFPFLSCQNNRHGFFRFYVIYLLSKMMAEKYADVSVDLQPDVFDSSRFVDKLSKIYDFNLYEIQLMKSVVQTPKTYDYQDDLLDEIRLSVDQLMLDSGLVENFPEIELQQIKKDHPEFWGKQKIIAQSNYYELLGVMADQQATLTNILAERDQALENQGE